MPYLIRKAGPKFNIVRATDGKVVGTSDNRAKAEASIRARMAGEAAHTKPKANMKRVVKAQK